MPRSIRYRRCRSYQLHTVIHKKRDFWHPRVYGFPPAELVQVDKLLTDYTDEQIPSPPPQKKIRRTDVRQGTEDEGVLQALPGQVPSQARGQDRLPGAQEVDLPGQEQVQLPQVQARGALHQQVRAGADHLRHHPGRRVHVPGLLQGAPPVRLQGRTQELRRGVLHGSAGGPPPAPPAGERRSERERERDIMCWGVFDLLTCCAGFVAFSGRRSWWYRWRRRLDFCLHRRLGRWVTARTTDPAYILYSCFVGWVVGMLGSYCRGFTNGWLVCCRRRLLREADSGAVCAAGRRHFFLERASDARQSRCLFLLVTRAELKARLIQLSPPFFTRRLRQTACVFRASTRQTRRRRWRTSTLARELAWRRTAMTTRTRWTET